MQVPWEALCEAFFLNLRGLIEQWSAAAEADGRLTAEQAAQMRASPEFFRTLLEGIRLGPVATASELERFRDPGAEDLAALEWLLLDPERMHFVRSLAWNAGSVPRALVRSFARGAVYTRCPSSNRDWIQLAVPVDPVAVRDTLFWFLEHGNPFEAGGAVNALYWFHAEVARLPRVPAIHDNEPAFDERYRRACLTRFVDTDDLRAQRCLVGRIRWEPSVYPPELHSLLHRAIAKASGHTDEYIRQRYLYDTGQSGLIPCLPHSEDRT